MSTPTDPSRPTVQNRLRRQIRRNRRRARYLAMRIRNRVWRSPVVGDADVIVSLATHGRRIDQAFESVEAIARGRIRPRRLIVCLPAPPAGSARTLPASLRRLERRGVEVWWTEDRGPHNKYFPFLISQDEHVLPLVTADDDCHYPRRWLLDLVEAHRRHPDAICAPRCRTMVFDGPALAPYASWPLATSDQPSPRRFATGVSGVLYPPSFLAALRLQGDPKGTAAGLEDDVWINATAAAGGTPVRQLTAEAQSFPATERSGEGLSHTHADRKDHILEETYDTKLLAALSQATG